MISRADFEAALGEHGFPLSRPTAEDGSGFWGLGRLLSTL